MRILLTRLPLFAGIFLLQIPPATVPTNLGDLLFQALASVPVYVILAYIVINMQRDHSKESERRDKHEEKITNILDAQIKRIDDIEEDRKVQWEAQKQENEVQNGRIIESFDGMMSAIHRLADESGAFKEVLITISRGQRASDTILSEHTNAIDSNTARFDTFESKLDSVKNDVAAVHQIARQAVEGHTQLAEKGDTAITLLQRVLAQLPTPTPPAVVVNNVTPVTPADELPKASGA